MHPEPATPNSAAVRVLAIADTDSYLKWSAATLEALPDSWESTQLLIENPVMPSAAQIRAVSNRPVEVLTHAALVRRIRTSCPDVVLFACTGPVVATLTAQRVFWGRTRPVLVAGLPGISVPATRRAVTSRAACDLFLLHSKREVAEFAEVGAQSAPRLTFGLAPLPFLPCSYARHSSRSQARTPSGIRCSGEGAGRAGGPRRDPAGTGRCRVRCGQTPRLVGGTADPQRDLVLSGDHG